MKEERLLQQQQRIPFNLLGVMIIRSDALNPWRFELRGGPPRNRHFRERFQQTATDAALSLRMPPQMATPVAFWMDRLFQHCVANWPEYISSHHTDSGGGSLEALCEVSATYCAWRDRQIIESTGQDHSDVDAVTEAVIDALETGDFQPQDSSDKTESTDTQSTVLDAPSIEARRAERHKLFENYAAQFPEKIVILDICWAAKQRYREWKRWLSGQLKDTSKANKAFHALLTSRQRPTEYRTEPRQKKWQ